MSSSLKNIFQDYFPPGGIYDEFVEPNGIPRTHIKSFLEKINQLDRKEFEHRWVQSQRAIQANDFAYTGHGKSERPRPWELDAIPYLLPHTEWKTITRGLQQRAVLLNKILQDLYGKQILLKEGLIPPELLYSHPGFLRPYHGQKVFNNCFIHIYATDLGRSPDGKWWVLADRTESPSGLGFALENRILVSRMLPDIFQSSQVSRLAPFFITFQETLRSLAPDNKENPRIVLLSHGPSSPNYIEDAYLARYLGYTLVEGGDLTIRNNQVMLKTLGGLLKVDVILRRQNSKDCDPLELDPASKQGIPGLTQAARSGNVGIANALGSGLIESPAIMPYVSKICKYFFNEELIIPSVASWWCGSDEQRTYVLDNLQNLTIEPAFRIRGDDVLRNRILEAESQGKLKELIMSNPRRFAAQEKVSRSSVPVWKEKLQSSYLALRTYSVASDDSYELMQGALARITNGLEPLNVSLLNGEKSKDAWILSEGPVEHITLLEGQGQSITLKRSGDDLPSRAADNIFWLGRYLERAEISARILRSTVFRLVGESRLTNEVELPTLLRCLADQGQIEPGYIIDKLKNQLPIIEEILPITVFDESQSTSLRSVLNELFRLGSIVRDRITLDTWRILHDIDKGFRPMPMGLTNLTDVLTMTDDLITELAAFSGIVSENMTRTQSFLFLDLGRRIERALQIIKLVKNFFTPMPEKQGPVFETILEVADSLMTYRSRYLSNFQLDAVLDLILTDETNPRSLIFQLEELSKHIDKLPRTQAEPGYNTEQRLVMTLLHSTRMLDIQEVAEVHILGNYKPLEEQLTVWETQLSNLSEAVSHRYLIHAAPSHQLSDIYPNEV